MNNKCSIRKMHHPLSIISSDVTYPKKLLSGLGKSTKRGIKKCYRCGVYNGTRSTMCKNKICGIILKDSEEKSKVDLDAVKLLTGTEKQVYSVRVRDMGPDYRGFVQLPVLQMHSQEDSNIFSEVALCFVNYCQNSFDNSILKCHEEDQNDNNLVCAHIKSALKSQSTASPVELKNNILQSMRISVDVKDNLFCLATEKEGYLVQRVSKSIMAVKCQVSPKHPLGYLHFTFVRGRGKDFYDKYYCSCTEFVASSSVKDRSNNAKYKCIHYYACIWALASDLKYSEEFSHLIQNALSTDRVSTTVVINNDVHRKHQHSKPTHSFNNQVVSGSKHKEMKITKKYRKKEVIKNCYKIMPRVLPVEIKVLNEIIPGGVNISWNFLDWLSYVTESINMTMQFENCGVINTLVFQVPENFYNCFIERIPRLYDVSQTEHSMTYKIMYILHLKEIFDTPQNFYNCFIERIPRLYDVSQTEHSMTYKIMYILHLKEIFDTPQVKLKISKKFVHTDEKGYIEYDENDENNGNYQCSFIFFLNVGQSTVDESDNTNNAFLIQWIPSVTNLTRIGQLKLQYKYGRKST